jgi:transcriptional regulator of arginine metabolism
VSKRDRHQLILEILREHRVNSQEGLRTLLVRARHGRDAGHAVPGHPRAQAREGARGGRGPHYAVPDDWDGTPALESLLPTLFHSAEGVDHLLVVRTMKGGAQTVAAGIDWEEWPEVLGTLAGDDTILLVLRDPGTLDTVKERLERMAR